MRIAYADPPYPGMSKKHYGDHEDYDGEVDHAELIERIDRDYDGWVLHTGASQLKQVLALCPDDVRILAWTKGWASFKPGVSIKYAWEPVLIRGARKRPADDPFVRDWFMCNATTNGFVGGKPRDVCNWIFECMALLADDDLDDLYPGSGAVSAAWIAWRSQLSLLSTEAIPSADPANDQEREAACRPPSSTVPSTTSTAPADPARTRGTSTSTSTTSHECPGSQS